MFTVKDLLKPQSPAVETPLRANWFKVVFDNYVMADWDFWTGFVMFL